MKKAASGAVVIDDSYNANPDPVRAAIDVLAAPAAPTALVLGDMGEVGEQGPQFHREVGAYAREGRLAAPRARRGDARLRARVRRRAPLREREELRRKSRRRPCW